MKMRYFLDGVHDLSDDVEVVAQSDGYWFVITGTVNTGYGGDIEEGQILLAVPKSLSPVQMYMNSEDDPPNVLEYFNKYYVEDLRFHYPHLNILN